MFAPPQGLMRSAHHARDRSLISHNLSDVAAARMNRDSRGEVRDLRTRFICRRLGREFLAPTQRSVFRSPNSVAFWEHIFL